MAASVVAFPVKYIKALNYIAAQMRISRREGSKGRDGRQGHEGREGRQGHEGRDEPAEEPAQNQQDVKDAKDEPAEEPAQNQQDMKDAKDEMLKMDKLDEKVKDLKLAFDCTMQLLKAFDMAKDQMLQSQGEITECATEVAAKVVALRTDYDDISENVGKLFTYVDNAVKEGIRRLDQHCHASELPSTTSPARLSSSTRTTTSKRKGKR